MKERTRQPWARSPSSTRASSTPRPPWLTSNSNTNKGRSKYINRATPSSKTTGKRVIRTWTHLSSNRQRRRRTQRSHRSNRAMNSLIRMAAGRPMTPVTHSRTNTDSASSTAALKVMRELHLWVLNLYSSKSNIKIRARRSMVSLIYKIVLSSKGKQRLEISHRSSRMTSWVKNMWQAVRAKGQ